MNLKSTPVAILLLGFLSCQPPSDRIPDLPPPTLPTTVRYETGPKGKDLAAAEFATPPYGPLLALDSLGFPAPPAELSLALERQRQLIDRRWQNRTELPGPHELDGTALRTLHAQLTTWLKETDPSALSGFRAVPLSGQDGRGNVKFTGYYAPELEVRHQPNTTFRYPIYRFPKGWEGRLPNRRAIDEQGVLRGKGLEIAYAADPVDVYYLQLQGSGYLNFVDTGERRLVTYDGTNRHRYRSMERAVKRHPDLRPRRLDQQYLKPFLAKHPKIRQEVLNANPSYTFFRESERTLSGAAGIPLTAGLSVAVDPEVVPLGSVLLAALPISEDGVVTHHEYRLFFAHDTGGKIRGSGRVDVFFGSGAEAAAAAGKLYHYGKLWILHPADAEQLVASLT